MIKKVLFGALFGFVLSRVGATSYDTVSGMFRLTDLHLMGVIAVAITLSALGFQLFRRGTVKVHSGEAPKLKQKPMVPGLVVGSLLFGVGWALAGTCPGTAIAQIGEGTLAGGFTFLGVLVGARLATVQQPQSAVVSTSSRMIGSPNA